MSTPGKTATASALGGVTASAVAGVTATVVTDGVRCISNSWVEFLKVAHDVLGAPPRGKIPDDVFRLAWEDDKNRRILLQLDRKCGLKDTLGEEGAEQERRMVLWYTLRKHDFRIQQFSSSLYALATKKFRGALVDYRKLHCQNRMISLELIGASVVLTGNHYPARMETEQREAVTSLTKGLKERARAIIVAHFVDGVGIKELAKQAGTRQKVIKRVIEKSLQKMKEEIEKDHDREQP